jgi:prolyl 4-hydroxylase
MKIIKHTETIMTVENFWSHEKCDEYIVKTEQIGYTDAKINTGMGHKVVKSVRNNLRVIHEDYNLAANIWEKLKDIAPREIGNSQSVGLNELFRFYRYEPGQQFKWHRDGSFIRNQFEASYYTFMIYLNDNFSGEDTTFTKLSIKPQKGTALIFLHRLEHAGSQVTEGVKYVLRTDIIYKIKNEEVLS